MSFRSVFIAIVIGFALIVSAFLLNRARPRVETDQPSAAFVRASGKCAECHTQQQYSVVHEYEMSVHAQKGVNCLDCHQPARDNSEKDHHGFVVSTKLTAGNCRSCHEPIYQEFLRSRHAAPSWAAVYGEAGLKPRAGRVLGTVPAGRHAAPGPSADRSGRRVGDHERLRAVPQRRQAERRRHDRHLHGLPHPAHLRRWRSRGCRRRAANATWGPITRSSRSTKSRSTA